MWCGKQILRIKENQIYELNRKVERLEADLKWAKDELKTTRDAYTSLARQAPVVIDWNSFEVFSVERMHTQKDGRECLPYTVVGYWKTVNDNGQLVRKTGEWLYQVDEIGHMKIAQDFKDYLDRAYEYQEKKK